MGFELDENGRIQNINLSDYEDSTLEVTGIAKLYPAGFIVPYHRHKRYHLLYAEQGVMAVESNRGRWVVPSSAAIWLRPMVEHQLIIQSQSRIYGILVSENTKAHLPPDDGVLLVSPMLRELIFQITKVSPWDAASKRNALVRALFLEELYLQPHLTFYLPLPTENKMAEICRRLMVTPADTRGVEEWAKSLSVSEKTFQRHFIKQTGMTFGQWKQRLRLLSSITLLLAGNSIINTALETGYCSHSAYSTAFKKLFGVSPSHFIYSSLSNPRQAHGFGVLRRNRRNFRYPSFIDGEGQSSKAISHR